MPATMSARRRVIVAACGASAGSPASQAAREDWRPIRAVGRRRGAALRWPGLLYAVASVAMCAHLLSAVAAAPATIPRVPKGLSQSRECAFFETPESQEFVARMAAYDDARRLETAASEAIAPAAAAYSMRIVERSALARLAPTDFAVLQLYSCVIKSLASPGVCHRAEADMRAFEDGNVPPRVRAVHVNKPYRQVELLQARDSSSGSGSGRSAGQRTPHNVSAPPLKNLLALRKRPRTQLVDELGVRELWERGYKGQGVRVAVFDTGVSSTRAGNVKERVNWTNEKKNDDSAGHGTFVASVITGSDDDCPGIAPEAELFVFRMFTDDQLSFTSWYLDAFNYALFKGVHVLNLSTGGPDFQDLPFVEKIKELAANGIILVSAVGNNGPRYGLLSNPADQMEVIGVGGATVDDEVAEFSSRGMTTWEFPFGSGRVKPDIVALAEDVSGSDVAKGCKLLSGTSASAPIVSASIAVLASMIPEHERWQVMNPASTKQILLESAERLEAWRESEAYVVHNHIFEQGAGKLNVTRASELVAELWSRHRAASARNGTEISGAASSPSSFPDRIDTTDCPYMWPLCAQPLYHSSLPLMVNLTVLNPASVAGTLVGAPHWVSEAHGDLLTVSVASPEVLWPFYGSLGVFIEVKQQGSQFNGIASGDLIVKVRNGQRIDEVAVPVRIRVIPTPPKAKRVLWDQFRNIPYPSAFVPRDSLENTRDLLDSAGDHPHTNYHQLWNFLVDHGYSVEILPFELSCVKLEQYGVVMIVDPEEAFFEDEVTALRSALKFSNVSLILLADWFDESFIDAMEMFDTSTLSRWHAITGGANVPAINELLSEFHIALGQGAVSNSSVSLLSPAASADGYPYSSGSFITNFPVGGYLGFIDAIDQIALTLDGSKRLVRDVPVLGLYQVPSRNGGRIAVFGDSACVDASSHSAWSASKFRNCFEMVHSLLRFTTDAVSPSQLGLQGGAGSKALASQPVQGGLQLLDSDYAPTESSSRIEQWPATLAPTSPGDSPPDVDADTLEAGRVQERPADLRAREFARYSKVARANRVKPVRESFCHFYRREECSEQPPRERVTMQAVVTR